MVLCRGGSTTGPLVFGLSKTQYQQEDKGQEKKSDGKTGAIAETFA